MTSFWLDHVAETISLPTMLQLEPQKIPGFYGFPVLTLVLATAAMMRTVPRLQFRWIVAVATLAALIGISVWEMRGTAAATMIAAPIFPVCLVTLWPAFAQGRKLLLAALVASPAILAATDHSVFAAPYHRNNDGNLAMLRVMMAGPPEARRILRDRQVDYIVSCAGSLDQADFVKLAPDGLAARLGRGEILDFLRPVELRGAGQLLAWRVRS